MGDRAQSPPVGLEDSSRLCTTCQVFQNSGIVYETQYSQLATSAQSGCDHCKWLEHALFDQAYAELVTLNKPVSVRRGFNNSIQLCEIGSTDSTDNLIRLEVYTPFGAIPIWKGLGYLEETSSDPSSEDSLHQIKEWSQLCLQTHEACQQNEIPPLPTRVLDLSNAEEPRIIETHGARDNYIAVSHCWGTGKGLTATSQNMSVLASSMNPNALMKTFRDAILIAQVLNISKVWIDSLCILQDSLEDWKKESSKMWDIYRNAFITVVAAGAAGDTEGFLGPRKLLPTIRNISGDRKIAFRHHAHSDPIQPLYLRAWAFQERFLSPRMINFERQELQWHCRASRLCECRQSGKEGSKADGITSASLASAYQGFVQGSLEEALNIWRDAIIRPYSCLLLTKESDRLPALSGVASLMKSRFPDEIYLSGLWSSDLSRGLQWICERPERHAFSFTIPSWSWLTARGPVSYCLAWSSSETRKVLTKFIGIDHENYRRHLYPWEDFGRRPAWDYKSDLIVKKIFLTGPMLSLCYSKHRAEKPGRLEHKINSGLTKRGLGKSTFYPDGLSWFVADVGVAVLHLLALDTEDNGRVCRCLVLRRGSYWKTYFRVGVVVLQNPVKLWFKKRRQSTIMLF